MNDRDASLATALADVLGAQEVTDLVRLSGGASRETFRFVADGRPLVLQRQRAGDVRSMRLEAQVLRAARSAGVPVAELVAASGDGPSDIGSSFIVSAAVDGETIARKILRDDEYAEARRALPAQFGRALAQLHRTDVSAVTGLTAPDQVSMYRDILDGTGEAHPAFELAFKWLEEHRPASSTTTLVHGDFRLGNVIVDQQGLAAVIDWELAHLGDPMEDLGWLCTKAWRFGSPLPVGGVGTYEQLIAAYEQESGLALDLDVVRWWEVLGTLKWGIMCIGQAMAHTSGAVRSHELAAIGRRVCENEHDLFLALEGRW